MSLLLVKRDFTAVQPFTPVNARETVCGCDFATCFVEKVFAAVEGTGEYWKADKSDFLFKKQIASDTANFQIIKNGVVIATITDNTFGDYYASFTNAVNTTGFLADWTAIFAEFGGGKYNININYTTFGTTYNLLSRDFRLYPYSTELAHYTTRLETYQTGNILNLDIDYSALLADLPNGWYSSMRIEGRFYESGNTLEVNEYLDTNYERTQNNSEVINTYSLETSIIPDSVKKNLTNNMILANRFLITDYDLYASQIFRRQEVAAESFETVEQKQQMGGTKFVILFNDRFKNIKKRNF